MPESHVEPVVEFFRLVNAGRSPERADRSVGGTLPTRAFRYCEAVTTASALGWYVFPPVSFDLLWTESEVYWTYQGISTWYPLSVSQFPGFREQFYDSAPIKIRDYAPPFLGALRESGIIQIWSGLVARSKPGWSLLVRGPANLPRSFGYDVFEGVIDADDWFGPLFINVRLTRTGSPVHFDSSLPLFQIFPIPRTLYTDRLLNNIAVKGLDELGPDEWHAYYRSVVEPSQQRCPLGAHAAATRKRRHSEAMGGMAVSDEETVSR